jgi:hypothetical protein
MDMNIDRHGPFVPGGRHTAWHTPQGPGMPELALWTPAERALRPPSHRLACLHLTPHRSRRRRGLRLTPRRRRRRRRRGLRLPRCRWAPHVVSAPPPHPTHPPHPTPCAQDEVKEFFGDPYSMQMYGIVFGYLSIARMTVSYQRYWEVHICPQARAIG